LVLYDEISFNPFTDRKIQILKWKNIAIVDIEESKEVIGFANEIMDKNIRPKDALHLSCAIKAKCDFFITTDTKVLKKSIKNFIIVDPIDFIRTMGV